MKFQLFNDLIKGLTILGITCCLFSCSKHVNQIEEKSRTELKSSVFNAAADSYTFVVPANKAYAEPFEPNSAYVGVNIPVNYPQDYLSVNNWTNRNRSVVYYLYQTAGQYDFHIDHTVRYGTNLNYQVKVSPCYDGLSVSPNSKDITFSGTGSSSSTSPFRIQIGATGYYRYELKPVSSPNNSITIHNLIFKALQNNSKVNHTDYQSSPSVHLAFSSTATTTKSYNWLYQDIYVPAGGDPLHTFYMGIGFYRGYLGIQTNSPTERRVLFSVWDSADAQTDPNHTAADNVILVDKGPNVTSNGFGNEGTGGQTYINANWQTGQTVSMALNVRLESNNKVLLSAWYKLANQSNWNYIATWRAPKDSRYFDGFYSFIENFGFTNGQKRREAQYFNSWAREHVSGNWVHLNKASFSNTDGAIGQRVDFEQGVMPSNSNRFYMSSGGYTPTLKTENTVTLQTGGPSLDIVSLNARIDQALGLVGPSNFPLEDGAVYKIISAVNNNSVLDVNSHRPINETLVSLWSSNSPLTNNQKFLARKVSGGYFVFKSMADTSKVMDVKFGSATNGAQIQVYNFNNNSNQKWAVMNADGGYATIRSALGTNKAIDVNNGSTNNGTKIQLWTSNLSNSQKFLFVKQ